MYHLPHADLSRLGARRNPFATEEEKRNGGSQASRMDARYVSTSGLSVTSRMSGRSISKKKVRAMLGAAPENQGFNSLVASKINASRLSLAASVHEGGFHGSSRRGSIASMMGGPLQPVIPMRTGRRGSTLAGMGDAPHAGPPVPQFDGNRRASMLGAGALHLDSHRRTSTFGPGLGLGNGRVMPMSEPEQQNVSVNLLVSDETESVDETSWRALPKWWTDIIPNRVTASVSLVIVSGLTGYVLVYDIMYPPT